jgi:hypothetical protein
VVVGAAAFFAPAARAADRVFWTNAGNSTISFAQLDGTGGGQLPITGATPSNPGGVTIDPAAGKIYWTNLGNNTISFARVDGTGGGGQLPISGGIASSPAGLAIDPAAGTIYWANQGNNTISFARLDGTGDGQLPITGATASFPTGVAIDPTAGKIYWANQGNNTISFARLDGTGGGQLPISGATPSNPTGIAIDPTAGKIYWANLGNNTISFARLDGTGGGGQLPITGATASTPYGVAIDPTAGKIYWANDGNNTISFAGLDGTGGGQLPITGATPSGTYFPALFKAPSGAGAPAISGGSAVGSMLSCSQGAWAPDLLGSFLYRAPQSFAFQWSVGGNDIPGATTSAYTAVAAGDYRCRVTASNQAGSTSQTSAPHTITSPTPPSPVPPAPANFTGSKSSIRVDRKGRFRFSFRATQGLNGSARLESVKKVRLGRKSNRKKRVTLARKSFSVPAGGKVTLRLKLSKTNLRILKLNRKIRTRVTVKLTNAAGLTSTANRQVTLKAPK